MGVFLLLYFTTYENRTNKIVHNRVELHPCGNRSSLEMYVADSPDGKGAWAIKPMHDNP